MSSSLSSVLNKDHDKRKDEKVSAVHDGVALKIQKVFIEWLETDRSAKKLHLNITKKPEERAKKYSFERELILFN